MGSSTQGISNTHTQGKVRHTWPKDKEGVMRKGTVATGKGHCKAKQKLHIRRHNLPPISILKSIIIRTHIVSVFNNMHRDYY